MSRIRSIHPGLWTDERFVVASPMARLLFMGIWNECDDLGSFEWSPLKLKMRLLPADAVDASALLEEIESSGSIMRYTVGDKTYGAVRNFCQYQRPKKPVSHHPQTEAVRAFVNVEARTIRDGGEPVGNQSGTDGEKPRQMKDEGGDKEVDDAIASPTPRKRVSDFEISDWVPEEPWQAFVEFRRAIPKVPFTVRAAKEIIGDLDKLRSEGHDPGKVLLLSVKRGWRGVFGDDSTKGSAGDPGAVWTPERKAAYLAKLDELGAQPPPIPPRKVIELVPNMRATR